MKQPTKDVLRENLAQAASEIEHQRIEIEHQRIEIERLARPWWKRLKRKPHEAV